MRLGIEATDELVFLDGVPVRVWKGISEDGVPCIVFVHRIAVEASRDLGRFERELREAAEPVAVGLPEVPT